MNFSHISTLWQCGLYDDSVSTVPEWTLCGNLGSTPFRFYVVCLNAPFISLRLIRQRHCDSAISIYYGTSTKRGNHLPYSDKVLVSQLFSLIVRDSYNIRTPFYHKLNDKLCSIEPSSDVMFLTIEETLKE